MSFRVKLLWGAEQDVDAIVEWIAVQHVRGPGQRLLAEDEIRDA